MYQYPAYGRGLADAAFPSYGIPGVYRLCSGRLFAFLGMAEAATRKQALSDRVGILKIEREKRSIGRYSISVFASNYSIYRGWMCLVVI